MTAEEIRQVLTEQLDDIYDLYDNGSDDFTGLGLGKVTVVLEEDKNHDIEQQCYDFEKVFHFEDHNVYLRISGTYCSYQGREFDQELDSLEEVQPQEKVITVFTPKEQ